MKSRERALCIMIALLAATSAARGYQLYQDKTARAGTRNNPLKDGPLPLNLFDELLDGWFADRQDFPGIETKTREADREIIVELAVPGLGKDSLNIDVNETRIRVAYEARSVRNRTDRDRRRTLRSESVRRFEKVLPVPHNADGRNSRIEREGDAVRIVFPRKDRGLRADA